MWATFSSSQTKPRIYAIDDGSHVSVGVSDVVCQYTRRVSRWGLAGTHNIRHVRSGAGVRVVRPRTLIEEARAWLGSLGT